MHVLRRAAENGREFISSTHIAKELGLESIQVRKDVAATGITGQPGVGFSVPVLVKAIEDFLGWSNSSDALLVGAGNLGAALAGYDGFKEYGLNVSVMFDVDPNKINKKLGGVKVLSLDKLPEVVSRLHIRIGILTVPNKFAQSVADYMVQSGVRAIWNFTSVKLSLPEDVIVERVGLAASLAVLSSRLSEQIASELSVKGTVSSS